MVWRIDNKTNTVHVMVDVPKTAWIALGLPTGTTASMGGSWTVIGQPEQDSIDEWILPAPSTDAYKSLVPFKTQNLSDAEVTQTGGRTQLSFRRAVGDAGDKGRIPFNLETGNTVMIAYGSGTGKWGTVHGPIATATIQWMKSNSSHAGGGGSGGGLKKNLVDIHGICMTIAWGLLIPLGIVLAKNKVGTRDTPGLWFKVHQYGNILAVILTMVGLAVIVIAYNDAGVKHFAIIHAKIGLAVVVICGFQPLNAVARPGTINANSSPHQKYTRKVWEIMHKSLGYIATGLAWANIVVAFNLPYLQTDDMASLKNTLEPLFYAGAGLSIFGGFLLQLICIQKSAAPQPNIYESSQLIT